jgi:flagellar biosynthetic protein FlhB
MPEGKDQEKTEPATPKRREEARNKGQVALSREIPSVMIMMTALGVFSIAGSWMLQRLAGVMRHIFQNMGTSRLEDVPSVSTTFASLTEQVFIVLMPIMAAILVAGVAAHVAQIGFLFTGEPLAPKLNKLNPISGMKRFLSLRSFVELLKALVKVIIIGGVAVLILMHEIDAAPMLVKMDISQIMVFVGRVAFKICFYACLVLGVMAALDYAFQRWQHEEDLKMTKQEVKDEARQREGDPKVKARIRSIQIEMARRRMMEAVPEATVVVTNPTHLAVALKFKAKDMVAPQVVAKGAGYVAERIKTIAKAHNVPVIEQKPLAQALFKAVAIGGYIPVNLYRAVAEILAYVYRLKRMRG